MARWLGTESRCSSPYDNYFLEMLHRGSFQKRKSIKIQTKTRLDAPRVQIQMVRKRKDRCPGGTT